MHVGLNLLYLLPGVVGGTETYAAGLLDGLAETDDGTTFTVFVNRESADWPLPASPRFRRVVCPVHAARKLDRYRWEQLGLPAALRRAHRVDLLHSLGYVAPLRSPVPSVVSIHDLNFRAFGHLMPRVRRTMLRYFVERSGRRATRVITISEFAKREITSALGLPDERVVVTPLAARTPAGPVPDAAAVRSAHGVSRRYVIAFSSSTPNKNIPRLLAAFDLARRQLGLTHDLVLVGHPPTSPGASALRDGVHATGYVDPPTLRALLGAADLLVFPSLYEGFGLPVLEAMAEGIPVACSNAASLPEVGGDAAVYFDPHSVHDIAAAITRVAGDAALRATLARRGRVHAATFTWVRAADQTRAVYRAALGTTAPAERAPAADARARGRAAAAPPPGRLS